MKRKNSLNKYGMYITSYIVYNDLGVKIRPKIFKMLIKVKDKSGGTWLECKCS